MTYVLGLTGSIGMGKSTTAGFFEDAGIPVWDADAAVHKLYDKGEAGARAIEALAPDAIIDGGVDRSMLREAIQADATLLKRIEAVIHPLVATNRAAFLALHPDKIVVCDIPLLFETNAQDWLSGILVVTTDPEIQRQRVMDREGMTAEIFESILSKQIPDAEKRKRADFTIDTGKGLDHARAEVLSLIDRLQGGLDA